MAWLYWRRIRIVLLFIQYLKKIYSWMISEQQQLAFGLFSSNVTFVIITVIQT